MGKQTGGVFCDAGWTMFVCICVCVCGRGVGGGLLVEAREAKVKPPPPRPHREVFIPRARWGRWGVCMWGKGGLLVSSSFHVPSGMFTACQPQVGAEAWRTLRDTYPTINNCGFSDAELDSASSQLLFERITQAERRRHLHEWDNDGEENDDGMAAAPTLF